MVDTDKKIISPIINYFFLFPSIECRLTDLRPCTEYHIRIHALTEMGPSQIRGGASDTVSFLTKSCEPDKPAPPKLVSRNKTSLNLRWNAPNDNGKSILQYILESDEGRIPPQQVCKSVIKLIKLELN